MKKIISFILCLVLCCSVSLAEIDLSGMSFDELVKLKAQINLAMWLSQEWQEVTVPQGVWEVGKDIPAGHWTITAAKDAYCSVFYGEKLDDSGRDISVYSKTYVCEGIVGTDHWMYSANEKNFFDLNMKEGYFFVVENGNVVFSPYAGKPSLGFK